MSPEQLTADLNIWWVQSVLVGASAALLALVLRLPAGRGKLLYWQMALFLCLLLPALTPRPAISVTVAQPQALPAAAPALAFTEHSAAVIPWSDGILASLALGFLFRLCLFALGIIRLRRYRRTSVAMRPVCSWSAEADVRLSAEVTSPVTFGVLRPVILLPANFPELPEASRDAILCHEVLHVRRCDWLFAIGEELVRAALWFQPAIWWIVNEIQLAREQTVDAAVVATLNRRDDYIDALLNASGAGTMSDLANAPLFLRKRHLKQRLISMLKECSMSKTQRLASYAASFALLAATCWVVTTALPLTAAPQYVNDAPGVTVNTNGSVLIHRSGIDYPADLAAKGIEGSVQVQVKLDSSGNVSDASILSGPEELRKPILKSILDWHFSAAGGGVRQVLVSFVAPKGTQPAAATRVSAASDVKFMQAREQTVQGSPRIESIVSMGISPEATQEALSRLPIHQGDSLTPDAWAKTVATVREYDEHLKPVFLSLPSSEVRVILISSVSGAPAPVFAPPAPALESAATGPLVRVGGAVQATNLVRKVTPEYPALAKAARVQGTVRFETTVGPDGNVNNLKLVSGPALLVSSAMAAVQQWQYKPTLLNGNPVTVLTTVDVNFTLSE